MIYQWKIIESFFKRITFDIKVTIVVSCQMSFNDYPFDYHTCYFQVGSYFYDRKRIFSSLRPGTWLPFPAGMLPKLGSNYDKIRISRRWQELDDLQLRFPRPEVVQHPGAWPAVQSLLQKVEEVPRRGEAPLGGVRRLRLWSGSQEEARAADIPGQLGLVRDTAWFIYSPLILNQIRTNITKSFSGLHSLLPLRSRLMDQLHHRPQGRPREDVSPRHPPLGPRQCL